MCEWNVTLEGNVRGIVFRNEGGGRRVPAAEAHAVVFRPQLSGQQVGAVGAVVSDTVQTIGRSSSTVGEMVRRGEILLLE